jgi:hypothetical protein
MNLFQKLKHRNVFRVAVTYLFEVLGQVQCPVMAMKLWGKYGWADVCESVHGYPEP